MNTALRSIERVVCHCLAATCKLAVARATCLAAKQCQPPT